MRPAALAFAVAVGVAAVAPASAAASGLTYYVNQSAPAASDSNACTDQATPCLTIQAAIDKAKAGADSSVRVLPDPNGFVDTYAEGLQLTGPNAVTLEGAGSGAGGTLVAAPTSVPDAILAQSGSIVRSLHVTGGSQRAIVVSTGSVAERVVAEHATDTGALVYGGIVRDSTLSGPVAVRLVQDGKVVRSRITATTIGIGSFQLGGPGPVTSGSVLDSIVSGPVGTGATGLNAPWGGVQNQTVRVRHVTFVGFDKRVVVASAPGGSNVLEAVNSTFAGPTGTVDLAVGDTGAKASLININHSPARTTKGTGTIEELHPLDVDPMLSADGHLLPGSPLIDAGTTAGFLAGDPEDTLDIDRESRVLGASPDVGGDERPPPPPSGPPPGGPDTTAPALTSVRVPKRFRSRCPTPARPGCRAGMTIRLTLSEAGTVELLFRRIVRRRTSGSARPLRVRLAARSGANRLRFSGRIRRRALRSGRYRLSITAVDAAGNRSAAVRRKVRVL
ncbi:MAG TPA: hypothetical protein VF072_08880 [Thermoleophilaceae bacterium]